MDRGLFSSCPGLGDLLPVYRPGGDFDIAAHEVTTDGRGVEWTALPASRRREAGPMSKGIR